MFKGAERIFNDMTKRVSIVLCCLLSAGLYVTAAEADNDEGATAATPHSNNPYQAIADRNAFGLKPPPPPPEVEKPKTPPPKITLTGITTRNGKKTVFLKTPGTPGKPGEAAKEQYYAVTQGGPTDRDIELLDVDEKAGSVRLKYEGTEVPLNFVDNGAKVVAPPPGQIGQPGIIPPPGGANPQYPTAPGAAPNFKQLPTRTLRLPTPTAPAGANPVNPGVGMVVPNQVPQSTFNQNQLSAEQQILMVELERERTRDQVAAGTLPPLPPTPMSPPGSLGTMTPGATRNGPPGFPPIPQ